MKLLRVTNIQRGCVFDGPGVRTTVFLKGCMLRCPWCCNPETISPKEEWYIDESKCLVIKGISSEICYVCEKNGGTRIIKECPFGVAEPTSSDYSVEELLESVLRDEKLYRISGGGVTFSGGEPLLQSKELTPLLVRLKEREINVALETTLIAPPECLQNIKKFIDIFMVDVKLQPQMFLYSPNYKKRLLNSLNDIRDYNPIFRMVFVDEVWHEEEMVLESLLELNIADMELLLCHKLGENKYKKLSKQSHSYSAKKENAEYFAAKLSQYGIKTKILSI